MKIELKSVTISELVDGFEDNSENGVIGYGGKLDIRPPYQREFIYKDKQRMAVIDTIKKEYPLNVMYWAAKEDGTFEVIDGQQRTISICQFVTGEFTFDMRFFKNLTDEEKEQILKYELMVYVCSGTQIEKLKWFETINIAGEKLTPQELLNAVYSGPWLTDAKKYFSKTNCVAYALGSDYLVGSPIRQEYLETAIKWISKGNIQIHMANHQHDQNASALWRYFQDVITWVELTFTTKRKTYMKGIEWGELYNEYKDNLFNSDELEKEISRLILDDDVTNKKGIYTYVLTKNRKHLSIRAFSPAQRQKAYEKQKGICMDCKETFTLEEMEADHITPWHLGGKTNEDNCQLLCKECNRRKSGK